MKIVTPSLLTVLATVLSLSVAAQIKVGVCTKIQNAQKVKEAGAAYIEESARDFLMPQQSDEKFAANLALAKASPLPMLSFNNFLPGSIKLTGPDRNHRAALQYADVAFRRAGACGAKYMVLGSSGARNIPEGYDRETGIREFVEFVRRLGPAAAKHNIIVVLEPLNKSESNFFNLVSEGIAMVKEVNHPNIRCLADVYHMLKEGENPEILITEKEYILHCHVAEKQNRAVPGTFKEDVSPYFDALKEAGYRGGMSLEPTWTDFDTEVGLGVAEVKKYIAGGYKPQ